MTCSEYALYRYFDVRDSLLYIGKTGRLASRETRHIARSRWMFLAARSAIERYPDAEALQDAERKAIKAEHPLFNKQYNDTPEARERLRLYLDEIGRPDLLLPEVRRARRAAAGAAARVTVAVEAKPTAGTAAWPSFRRLAAALIQPAREALAMDHGEFALYLGSLLGWTTTPDAIGRWEAGSIPPGDACLACGDIVLEAVIRKPDFPLSAEARMALTLQPDPRRRSMPANVGPCR